MMASHFDTPLIPNTRLRSAVPYTLSIVIPAKAGIQCR